MGDKPQYTDSRCEEVLRIIDNEGMRAALSFISDDMAGSQFSRHFQAWRTERITDSCRAAHKAGVQHAEARVWRGRDEDPEPRNWREYEGMHRRLENELNAAAATESLRFSRAWKELSLAAYETQIRSMLGLTPWQLGYTTTQEASHA